MIVGRRNVDSIIFITSLSAISRSDIRLFSANSFSISLKKFFLRWMTMIMVLLDVGREIFYGRKIGLNDPADPPNQYHFGVVPALKYILLRANFLVYVFFLIDHLKPFPEKIRPDGFLTAQA
jgi:hypothetical protein